ncbi:MAG TPA: hypothetical protein PLW01_12030 [Agitococcus sp.]|nr:hypothetical protein [Agitococcus sp.]
MMKLCLYLGMSCYLLTCASSVLAWNKDYQTEYVLGDSDSRLTAKQQALKQIQLQAMQEAGTYIQGQTQLLNDKLDEKINQVSAAIVKLQVLTEHFELTATGQQKLRLMARANVDESVLQQRVQALQQETNQAKQQQPILTAIQQEQQKLMLDNQLLRRQLQVLSQQGQLPANISPIPTEQKDLSLWLMALQAQWQQTALTSKLLTNADGTNQIKIDWRLSLKADTPLAQLCQRWTCQLGYAYKSNLDDAWVTPLHQQLFRPFSRIVHIDDKYISHWQILTVQAYPPQPLTEQELAFIQQYQVQVYKNIGQKILTIPLVKYDATQGALVIRMQGMVMSDNLITYDPQSRQGNLLCAVKLPKQCSPLEIESLGKDNGQMSVAKRVIDSY